LALKYRIGAIGWYNFETLLLTLLKGVIGPGVTSFGGSKDGGRDAVFEGEACFPSEHAKWAGRWVFQVKYVDLEQGTRTARTQLKNAFRKEIRSILAKRSQAQPDNYILITDVPLTARNREDIEKTARNTGFNGNFRTVDGREVCEFLDLYPQVRRSYPQLLGLVDLDRILNRDLYVRSEAYILDWQPRLSTFVGTEAYREALTALREQHFVVLDGPPEAGKSTIAAALALLHAADGFEVIDVRDPEHVFRIYEPSQSQLFVADDAVGSVSFDPGLTDSWSRDLAGILRKLDTKHLLVWTARSYVLEEAVAESRIGEAVKDFPGVHEVLVEVGKLSELEKAEILYNHAKQAHLSQASRALIRQNAGRIARHPNFTPERIRQLTEHVLPKDRSENAIEASAATWEDIEWFLRHPGTRWLQAYRALSPPEQTLLISMLDFSGGVTIDDLHRAHKSRASQSDRARIGFDECLDRLKHSFLRVVTRYSGKEYIDFQHPSLRDMLLSQLRNDEIARRRYIQFASPVGISSLIRGMASSPKTDQEDEHVVRPNSENELTILLDRLSEVSCGVLTVGDWYAILSATDLLLPRISSKAKLPLPQVDLSSFADSWNGKVVEAVVRAFGCRSTFDRSQQYSVAQWTLLLERYYGLAVYLVPPPSVEFVSDLAKRLADAEPRDGITLATLIYDSEPLVFKQIVSQQLMASWNTHIHDELDWLVEAGKDISAWAEDWRQEHEYWDRL
jgi:hypothetical protein